MSQEGERSPSIKGAHAVEKVEFRKVSRKQAREAIKALPGYLQDQLGRAKTRYANPENTQQAERARVSLAWHGLF